MARRDAAASMVRSGPWPGGGGVMVTVTLADFVASALLVAVTMTVFGAGNGVTYRPVGLIVPDAALPPVA